MPRKVTPPKHRGKDAVGRAPKVARNPNVDPDDRHRCQVCGQMRPDCVRSLYPPEPARYTCRGCLEAAGQMRLEG